MLCLHLCMCDSHFCMASVPGLLYLGTGCWNQSVCLKHQSEASLPIIGHSHLPGISFLPSLEEGALARPKLRTAAGPWPFLPLYGLLRAEQVACYLTKFPTIYVGNTPCRSETEAPQGCDLPRGTQLLGGEGCKSSHHCFCSGTGYEPLALSLFFLKQLFFKLVTQIERARGRHLCQK
jgi:hypothetical protein